MHIRNKVRRFVFFMLSRVKFAPQLCNGALISNQAGSKLTKTRNSDAKTAKVAAQLLHEYGLCEM
jgi:hypothetical protein